MKDNDTPAPRRRRKEPRRTAGRPASSSGVGKERIVEAALELMRHKAPEALTVVEVASAAKVDPALIRYYFGSKKGLLRAAAVGLLDDIQERSRLVLDEPGPLRHRIRTRLQMLIDSLQRNPQFMNLVLKEIYSDEASQMEVGDLNTVAKRGLALTQFVLNPIPGDKPARELDARYLHVAILGMCTFFMDAQPMLAVLFKDRPGSDALVQGYIEFATELLAKGIEAASPSAIDGRSRAGRA